MKNFGQNVLNLEWWPKAEMCCHFFNLRTGASLIALSCIISAICQIVLTGFAISINDDIIHSTTTESLREWAVAFLILLIINIILDVAHCILSGFLLYGIYKDSPLFVKLYVIIKFVLLLLSFILICCYLLQAELWYILSNVAIIVLEFYWLHAVFNFYRELNSEFKNTPAGGSSNN